MIDKFLINENGHVTARLIKLVSKLNKFVTSKWQIVAFYGQIIKSSQTKNACEFERKISLKCISKRHDWNQWSILIKNIGEVDVYSLCWLLSHIQNNPKRRSQSKPTQFKIHRLMFVYIRCWLNWPVHSLILLFIQWCEILFWNESERDKEMKKDAVQEY